MSATDSKNGEVADTQDSGGGALTISAEDLAQIEVRRILATHILAIFSVPAFLLQRLSGCSKATELPDSGLALDSK